MQISHSTLANVNFKGVLLSIHDSNVDASLIFFHFRGHFTDILVSLVITIMFTEKTRTIFENSYSWCNQ